MSFCSGLVRNSTSPGKNARIQGYFTLYQSVVLLLEMFVFDVFQKVANVCVCVAAMLKDKCNVIFDCFILPLYSNQ